MHDAMAGRLGPERGPTAAVNVAVVGASGRTGRFVVDRLVAGGHPVIAIGRRADRLDAIRAPYGVVERVVADVTEPSAIAAALAPADRVVSLAHARYTARLLDALPDRCERIVLIGSIRRDTALDDPVADLVRQGVADFDRAGVPGLFLHPAMIYGASDDQNVDRVLGLVRRWPRRMPLVVPLPDGGAHTVQPVFVDDLADAIVAALLLPDVSGPSIDVVGPRPISYAELVTTCAAALGRRARIVPAAIARPVLAVARVLPLPVSGAELGRAGESKRYDPQPMIDRLGVQPRDFADGLRLKLGREGSPPPG